MERIGWHVAYKIVEPYVVKIITPQASGTGFLIAATDETKLLGIATAAHVLDFAHYWEQPLRVHHAKTGSAVFLDKANRTIDIDYERDIAAVVLRAGSLPFPKDIPSLISEDKRMMVGVEIGWMGFPALAPTILCFFSGRTSSWVSDNGFYFVDGVAINGVSGGPAFRINVDNKVEIMGVVSAYVPNRVTGASLPGLCVVRDVGPLYKTINDLKSFDEAKKQEKAPQAPPPPPPAPSSPDQTRG